MGGGGGSGGIPSQKDLKRLEDLARQELRSASTDRKAVRNVFISFVQEDLNDINLLRGQAKNENTNLEFNDWSLREPFNSSRAEYVRRGIRERIRQSSVTLVYLSDQTAKSKWVEWEIEQSVQLGKGVIGVYKGEKPPSALPPSISKHGVSLVQWKHGEMAAAIEAAAQERGE